MNQADNYREAADWVQAACTALERATCNLEGRPTAAVATGHLKRLRLFEAELRGREEAARKEET